MNQLLHYACFVLIVGSAVATDYCSSTLCPAGRPHIACGHNGKFASVCASNAKIINFDESMKSTILQAHNEKRNFIAGGGHAYLKPACRMATMQWDEELASMAALNVRQCRMKHDKCRNTDTFRYVGQNLGWQPFSGNPDYNNLFQHIMSKWYAEGSYSRMDDIDYYEGGSNGHFTVMMADRNIRVGCAAATYGNAFLIACNYATTNMVGFPIYTSCSSAGSSCTTGPNSQYPNLCSTSEVYDVNKWY